MNDAVGPSPPPARPKVPVAATLLTALVGAGMLVAICAGGVGFAVARKAEAQIARSRARREQALRERDRVVDFKARLGFMAARLAATARSTGELPETLDEAPPKDPWGRPIQYSRTAPDRAVLSSMGPDGRFGTNDDVRYDVIAK